MNRDFRQLGGLTSPSVSAAEIVKGPKPVWAAVEDLTKATQLLTERLQALYLRLGCVMDLANPTQEAVQKASVEDLPGLHGRLDELRFRQEMLSVRVQEMLERLQV